MCIEFDVVIDSQTNNIDMKAGLDTLQGISEATRYIAEGLIAEDVPKKHTNKGKIRTTLKHTFKGSYGHIFGLDITDQKLKDKFNEIGENYFAELMTYFIAESLYQEPPKLSRKAERIIKNLDHISERIVNQLRVSALENIHEIATKFDQKIKIRHRKSRITQNTLATFDKTTVLALSPRTDKTIVDITACITRLNINTGNGRLQILGAAETVAFGFSAEYKDVKIEAKKRFSSNLDHNNGIANNDDREYMNLRVQSIKLKDGRIVKFIVRGIL